MFTLQRNFLVVFTVCCFILTFRLNAENSSDRIIWSENFSSYEVGSHPGCYHGGKGEIGEDSGKHYYRHPGGFMGGFDYFGARHWRNYELRFSLRPLGRFTAYVVVKSNGWRDKYSYMWYYIPISNDRVAPYAHGLSNFEEKLPAEKIDPPLEANRWYNFTIRVADSRIQVALVEAGGKRMLWDNKVLPGGGGVDFHGIGSGFDLADMVVEEVPD
jgi:hypothetical protein